MSFHYNDENPYELNYYLYRLVYGKINSTVYIVSLKVTEPIDSVSPLLFNQVLAVFFDFLLCKKRVLAFL